MFSKCASTFYWFTQQPSDYTVWNGASLRRLKPALWVVKQTRNEWYLDVTAEIVIKAYRMSNGQFALVHWIEMWTLWMKIAKRSVYARGSIIISEGWFLLAANSERSERENKNMIFMIEEYIETDLTGFCWVIQWAMSIVVHLVVVVYANTFCCFHWFYSWEFYYI